MSTQKELSTACGLGTLERPLYSAGLLLEDTDLTSAVDYTRQLTKMLFSSLFGCGVICGLRVGARLICEDRKLEITIGKGLGLDCFGNPIEVPGLQTITFDPDCDPFPPNIWVVACHVDKECAPRELSCGCDTGQDRAFTRHRSGFKIKVYKSMPSDACSCEKPQPDDRGKTRRCCGDDDDVDDGNTNDAKPEQDCYDDHMNGICACDCGCNCIVIGKISIGPDKDNKLVADASDRSAVRDIRPVPVGHYLKQQSNGTRSAADSTETFTKTA
jgi:hypothetical protein